MKRCVIFILNIFLFKVVSQLNRSLGATVEFSAHQNKTRLKSGLPGLG